MEQRLTEIIGEIKNPQKAGERKVQKSNNQF